MAKKPKSTTLKLDFSEVEATSFALPNGQYVLSVTSVEKKRSESSGNDYLSWEYKVSEGKHKGKKVWDNTSLQPQALWRLRGLFEAMGIDIEDGEIEVDLDDLEGESVGVDIENEKYQGKDKPRIVNFIGVDDVDGGEEEAEEEEEEEKPAPKGKAKGKAKEEEPEEEEEEEEKPAPKGKGKKKPEPEPEEEEEEEEKPAPKKKKKAAEPSFEVGQKVTFEDDGDTHTGKITAIEDETVTVKVGKDEWELDVSEITAA